MPDPKNISVERRRGRPAQLSREAVIQTARRIADEQGIGAVTMRTLARELGVTSMSIYRYVEDKDHLLAALLDGQMSSRDTPSMLGDPMTDVHSLLSWMYAGLILRPWVVDLIIKGGLEAPSLRWLTDAVEHGLVELGLTPAQATNSFEFLFRFVLGSAVLDTAKAEGKDLPSPEAEQPFDQPVGFGRGLELVVGLVVSRAAKPL